MIAGAAPFRTPLSSGWASHTISIHSITFLSFKYFPPSKQRKLLTQCSMYIESESTSGNIIQSLWRCPLFLCLLNCFLTGWEDKWENGWKASLLSVKRKCLHNGPLHLFIGGLWSTACCTDDTPWVSNLKTMWHIYFILVGRHRSAIINYMSTPLTCALKYAVYSRGCGRFSVTHEMDGKPSLKIVNVFPVSNEHVQEDFLF